MVKKLQRVPLDASIYCRYNMKIKHMLDQPSSHCEICLFHVLVYSS